MCCCFSESYFPSHDRIEAAMVFDPLRTNCVRKPSDEGQRGAAQTFPTVTRPKVWKDALSPVPSPSARVLVDASLPPARTCPDLSAMTSVKMTSPISSIAVGNVAF